MADSFDFTPESAAGPWSGPDVGVRRARVPTKEDLITALGQLQAQPQSPYQLQMEAPTIAGPEPNRQQQFQQDWDAAMQAYEQGLGHLKTQLPAGITYEGQNVIQHTPEEIFNQTIAPLRFRAAEFSPGINTAFGLKSLEAHRNAEMEHQKTLEQNAQDRIDEALRHHQQMEDKPLKEIPSSADAQILKDSPRSPEAWDRTDRKYGAGTAQMLLPKVHDPRPVPGTAGSTAGFTMPQSSLEGLQRAFPDVSNLQMPPGGTASNPFEQMPSRPQFTVPGPTLPSAPTVKGMVDMVDDKGTHWSIPEDKVADAVKKYKLKKLQ